MPEKVVYHNEWTDFESKEIDGLFECIPHEEAAKLEKGTTIWIDVEQPSGKVYGYDRAEVISVEVHDGHVSILFKGPYIQSGASVPKSGWHKVHRCTDEAELVELIKKSPLAIETGTVVSISSKSLKHLEGIGAVIVRA